MHWKLDFDTLIVLSDTATSVRLARRCRPDSRPAELRARIFLSPQSYGTPIIDPSASPQRSRPVLIDLGSTISISISSTLRLHFNPETSRIHAIRTATSSTMTG